MTATRPRMSVSLDLDNLWSYLKTHGDAGWESFPSYLDPLVDLVLERLRRHRLTITVFVVGQDAALPGNRAALRAIADAGHEVANHSFRHEPWLHDYSLDETAREIAAAEEAILAATGRRARGFRGPGFSVTPDVLRVLSSRGYLYDASTFPTFLGPLCRAWYFRSSGELTVEERRRRERLFGTTADALRPVRPYLWDLGTDHMLEIPVTTLPLFRVPLHMSYVIFLASHAPGTARRYLRTAMALCRAAGVEPSFLLHPLDFLGSDRPECARLGFFPGMTLRTDEKLRLFDEVMEHFATHFSLVTMERHAQDLLAERGSALELRTLVPEGQG